MSTHGTTNGVVRVFLIVMGSLCVMMGLWWSAAAASDSNGPLVRATAVIEGCSDPGIIGRARLVEHPSTEGVKQVSVVIRMQGLAPGKHAVHIHQTAQCMPCGDAGGHFDPGTFGFTSPDGNHPFHSGDLVNIMANERGNGGLITTTSRVTLSPGPLSLFDEDGSSFIIHTNADTYCPDGQVAGCAGGSRDACGIIVLRNDDE